MLKNSVTSKITPRLHQKLMMPFWYLRISATLQILRAAGEFWLAQCKHRARGDHLFSSSFIILVFLRFLQQWSSFQGIMSISFCNDVWKVGEVKIQLYEIKSWILLCEKTAKSRRWRGGVEMHFTLVSFLPLWH